MRKHFGFTLAEVLITLGIIGVVAAMTMPALINQTKGAEYKTAYKKAISAISQAIVLNYALDGWDLSNADSKNTLGNDESSKGKLGLFQQRMNVVRTVHGKIEGYTNDVDHKGSVSLFAPAFADENTSTNTTIFLNDGIMFAFVEPGDGGCLKPGVGGAVPTGENIKGKKCAGYIDVNGIKGPNKLVKCSKGKGDSCEVNKPTDIYEIVMYGQTVLPNSDAARAVLYTK